MRSRQRDQELKIRAVLWDLDGTLVQTEQLHWELERSVLAEQGITLEPAAFQAGMGRRTEDVLFDVLERAGGGDLLPAVLASRAAKVQEIIVNRALPIRGVESTLADIPMRTHRFALVTSTERAIATAILERFGWTWRFEHVVAGDDVEKGKPDPEPFLRACELLELPPDRPIGTWLGELQTREATTIDHEHVPLRDIQEWINQGKSLFDCLFVFDSYPAPKALDDSAWSLRNLTLAWSLRSPGRS